MSKNDRGDKSSQPEKSNHAFDVDWIRARGRSLGSGKVGIGKTGEESEKHSIKRRQTFREVRIWINLSL